MPFLNAVDAMELNHSDASFLVIGPYKEQKYCSIWIGKSTRLRYETSLAIIQGMLKTLLLMSILCYIRPWKP